MSDTPLIRPCRFCGSHSVTASPYERYSTGHPMREGVQARCQDCGAEAELPVWNRPPLPFNEAAERAQFETATFTYYAGLKAKGWSHPDEGDFTPAALFWREPSGRYGVGQIEAAWNGWVMKAKAAT